MRWINLLEENAIDLDIVVVDSKNKTKLRIKFQRIKGGLNIVFCSPPQRTEIQYSVANFDVTTFFSTENPKYFKNYSERKCFACILAQFDTAALNKIKQEQYSLAKCRTSSHSCMEWPIH